jgi:hypothetical protein
MGNWSDEETDEPLIADHRNFYKVEKWSRDGEHVVELLFAGSSFPTRPSASLIGGPSIGLGSA